MTSRLGIELPVVQGPFGGGLSTPELVAAVANRGGLGSYGAYHLDGAQIADVTARIRTLTGHPFALNLWIPPRDPLPAPSDLELFERTWRAFEPWFRELELPKPELPPRYLPDFARQADAVLEARPAAFSFVFGVPDAALLAACRARAVLTVGAATTVAEAEALAGAGVDAIVATGMEAGGHRPSFLAPASASLTGTLALVQLVAARVDVPVIAAGGIADARGVRAALQLGAAAAQLGTAFLACDESGTVPAHREALFSPRAHDTVLTRSFSGRLARGLRNTWTQSWESRPDTIAPFPLQQWFASRLRAAALAAGRIELVSLWGGQIAPQLQHRDAGSLMQALRDGLLAAPP